MEVSCRNAKLQDLSILCSCLLFCARWSRKLRNTKLQGLRILCHRLSSSCARWWRKFGSVVQVQAVSRRLLMKLKCRLYNHVMLPIPTPFVAPMKSCYWLDSSLCQGWTGWVDIIWHGHVLHTVSAKACAYHARLQQVLREGHQPAKCC